MTFYSVPALFWYLESFLREPDLTVLFKRWYDKAIVFETMSRRFPEFICEEGLSLDIQIL
jgi:hypothetical protein